MGNSSEDSDKRSEGVRQRIQTSDGKTVPAKPIRLETGPMSYDEAYRLKQNDPHSTGDDKLLQSDPHLRSEYDDQEFDTGLQKDLNRQKSEPGIANYTGAGDIGIPRLGGSSGDYKGSGMHSEIADLQRKTKSEFGGGYGRNNQMKRRK